MKAELISVGTELLLGQLVDTNAAFLASELPSLGIDCFFISQVGDNLERLVETLRRAWSRSDLIAVTGGLGPTEDDLTREAIAASLGETMTVQPDLEAELRARFKRLGRRMPETNLKQATLIGSARAIPNPIGSAPGWWVEQPITDGSSEVPGNSRVLVAMPGVPAEMRRMWKYEVKPRLRQRANGAVIVSRTLKVLGLGESNAEEMIRSLLGSTNPTIGTYAKADGIHLRLTAKAVNEAAAQGLIAPMEAQIRSILGRAVYGADNETPQGVVCRMLTAAGRTVATMDYGTGGALASLFGETPERPHGFAGGLVAGSRQGLIALGAIEAAMAVSGPVSEGGVLALANTARQRLGADVGLAVAGVLGPEFGEPQDVGTMFAGLDDGKSPGRTASVNYATAPSEMRRLAALAAVNLLRLALMET